MAEKLIIFSRFPRPGTTKTRLIPALGPAGAADVQRRMSELIVRRGRELAVKRRLALEFRYTGGTAAEVADWLGGGLALVEQGEGDLGARMARACTVAWAQGFSRVVLVGADCPGLSGAILQAAFDALASHDLVLGPAVDGGYYLLGLSRPAPELFPGQPWGEPSLLATTRAVAGRLGLSTHLLEELADVDCPADLHHLGDYPDLE